MSVDPLRVSCDEPAPDGGQPCGAGIGRPCIVWQRSGGNPRHWLGKHVEPHASRYAKAHHADHPTSSARYLVAGVPVAGSDLEPIARLIRARQAMPRGFDDLVDVLESGARDRGLTDGGIAPGTTSAECAEHAVAHAELADVDASSRDPVTGKLNFSHLAARGVMGGELEARKP